METKTIILGDKHYKDAKIILLPTEKAKIGTLMKCIKLSPLHDPKIDVPIGGLVINKNSNVNSSNEYWQAQNLYFVTDDEIKEGDWVLDRYNQKWQHLDGKLIGYDTFGNKRFSTDNVEGHICKKIIASTDPNLQYSLPSPSNEFLSLLDRIWNHGILENVLVQYIGDKLFVSEDNTIMTYFGC